MRRYSDNFNRDYKFYLATKDVFTFSGSLPRWNIISDPNGVDAKHCFWSIDSNGKPLPCKEDKLLQEILKCKESVNFHIKMYSEGRAEGIMTSTELEEICDQLNSPIWFKEAIDKQTNKLRSLIKM